MTDQKNSTDLAVVITWLIITVVVLFFACHLSAVVSADGFEFGRLTELTSQHIKEHPFDILHVNAVVFAVIGFATVMLLLMSISKPAIPRAEMKGAEHGSNDFQTKKELDEFLRKNTTEIFDLDNYAETGKERKKK